MKHLLTVALALSLAGSVSAQAPAPAAASPAAKDVTGTWNATFVTTTSGEIPAEMKLTRTADKLTGTISSALGESPLQAEQKGNAVTIWFSMQGQNGAIPIELSATVEGDSLKGTTMAGGTANGTWTATREKPAGASTAAAPAASASTTAPASLTGTWNVSLELPNISATPTMVLKQDGEKLTGEYVSQQYGKFPLTGTVKGSDVTIAYAMNVEGNALNVSYAGKIDTDGKITGTVNFGDMMNGTFAATRQK